MCLFHFLRLDEISSFVFLSWSNQSTFALLVVSLILGNKNEILLDISEFLYLFWAIFAFSEFPDVRAKTNKMPEIIGKIFDKL